MITIIYDKNDKEQDLIIDSEQEFNIIDPVIELKGILGALRIILEVREGESILQRAGTVMRRYYKCIEQLREANIVPYGE